MAGDLRCRRRAKRLLGQELGPENKKEPLPKKRLLDGPDLLVSVQSVESASRTALALDTSASLLQAVEMPAMDTAMDGAPVSTSFLLLFFLDLSI